MRNYFLTVAILGCASSSAYSQCNTSYNIALGKTAIASSVENGATPASNAFDGNLATRWSSAFTDAEYIYVDLGTSFPLCQVTLLWENAYGKNFTIDISNDAVSWTTVATITGNTSTTNTLSISGTGRYVRMNGSLRATGYGYSIYEFQVYSSNATPACPATDIALGRTATASSLESGAFPASNAFDGNTGTRWSSAFSDPQYIYVDLGGIYNLCTVNLTWENAYGQNFTIDASNDASTWNNLYTVTGNTSLTNVISVTGSGRYVRMYGTVRATGYGYSLYEFSVQGSSILPVTLTDFSAFEENAHSVRLEWKTQEEENNKLFEIQRSRDAKTYLPVGYIDGHGNSSIAGNYSFVDQQPYPGLNYYRLKQVDFDGKYAYSKIIPIDLSTTTSANVEVFPNPASNLLTIRSGPEDLIHSVQIYSQGGLLVKGNDNLSSSLSSVQITDLTAGLYFVRVNTTVGNKIFKIIKE